MLGPPLCTLTITKGNSAITARQIAYAFNAIPGPDDSVTQRIQEKEITIDKVIHEI